MEEKIGYDYDKLMQVVKHRGYLTPRSVAQVIKRVFGISLQAAEKKLDGTTRWSFEESFVIASYFEMTTKEYCDTFLNGLFKVDREGHFVCKVSDPGRVLRQRTEKNRLRKAKKEAERKEQEKYREELARKVEEL